MEKFALEKLSSFFSRDVAEEIVPTLISLSNGQEIRQYLEPLLDQSNPQQRSFIDQLLTKLPGNQKQQQQQQQQKKAKTRKKPQNNPNYNTQNQKVDEKPKIIVEKKSDLDDLEKQYSLGSSSKKDTKQKQNQPQKVKQDSKSNEPSKTSQEKQQEKSRNKKSEQFTTVRNNALHVVKDSTRANLDIEIKSKQFKESSPLTDKIFDNIKEETKAEDVKSTVKPKKEIIPYQTNKYKKSKFAPLEITDKYILLPGRRKCGCLAKEHKLVNNCTSCGWIACEQEGSGSCFFCGALVCTAEEQEILNLGDNRSEKLKRKLGILNPNEALANAQQLLKYMISGQEQREARQKIIDDQTDFYDLYENWSPEQVKEAERKLLLKEAKLAKANKTPTFVPKSESREEIAVTDKYTLKKDIEKLPNSMEKLSLETDKTEDNFSLKNTLKESSIELEGDKDKLDLSKKSLPQRQRTKNRSREITRRDMSYTFAELDPVVEAMIAKRPEMRMPELRHRTDLSSDIPPILRENPINIDENFWELEDFLDNPAIGVTIPQPWASLIMTGTKKFVGMNFETQYTGTVWIVSSAAVPTKEQIKKVENFYRNTAKPDDDGVVPPIKFPKKYPAGRVLGEGCIRGCYTREEYLEMEPDGKEEGPYLWEIQGIIPLPFLVPLNGLDGLFYLPNKLHTFVELCTRKVRMENPIFF